MKSFIFLICIYFAMFKALAYQASEYNIVPIRLVDDFVVVDVNINGHVIPLVLDTGSTRVQFNLNQKVLRRLKLPADTPQTQSFINTCGAKFSLSTVSLKKVKLGSLSLQDIKGSSFSKVFVCGEPQILKPQVLNNGFIGLGLFQNRNLILDYPRKQITLYKGEIPSFYSHQHWQNFRMIPSLEEGILTRTDYHNRKIKVLWDTGSTVSTIYAPLIPEKPAGQLTTVKDFNLESVPTPKLQFYTLGGVHPGEIGLGTNFFREHLVLFDFSHHLIRVAV